MTETRDVGPAELETAARSIHPKQAVQPPAAYVPLVPAEPGPGPTVVGFHVVVSWGPGSDPAAIGHTYWLHVLPAALAHQDVADAMSEAVLAGLCLRCSSPRDAERLIERYVMPAILENADQFAWAHGPAIDQLCDLCQAHAEYEAGP